MDSFYGGRQGASFVLVEHYDSVAQMVEAFAQGPEYEDVNWQEYVIIDTIINLNQKTNPENGLVYKRGYQYDEPLAIRPKVSDYKDELGNLKKKEYTTALHNYFSNPGGGAIYVGQIVGPQGESPALEVLPESVVKTKFDVNRGSCVGDIIAGDKQEKVTYAWCNLRDEEDNIIGCAIGFTVPYHIFRMDAFSVSAYSGTFNESTGLWDYSDLIHKTFGNTDDHPYQSNWEIHIPRGIHGKDFENLGIDPDTMQYYYHDRDYTRKEEGDVTKYYLPGIYHRVIKKVTWDESTSEFVFHFTTVNDTERIKARFLYDIQVDPITNRLEVQYSDYKDGQHVKELIGRPIKFIEWIEYDENLQRLVVYYNTTDKNGNHEKDIIDKQFKVIDHIEIGEDKKIYIYYNIKDENGNLIFDIIDEPLKIIDHIALENDNKLHIYYNVKDKNGNIIQDIVEKPFKFLEEIYLDDNSRRIIVQYHVGTDQFGNPIYESKVASKGIDSIDEMVLDPNNYHLYVLHTDPDVRKRVVEEGRAVTYIDRFGIEHNDWEDLGYIRGEEGGLHFIGDLIAEDELPKGPPPEEFRGWAYTVTKPGQTFSTIYVWDYRNPENGWYSIGTIDQSPKHLLCFSEADSTGIKPKDGHEDLNVGGLWFVIAPSVTKVELGIIPVAEGCGCLPTATEKEIDKIFSNDPDFDPDIDITDPPCDCPRVNATKCDIDELFKDGDIIIGDDTNAVWMENATCKDVDNLFQREVLGTEEDKWVNWPGGMIQADKEDVNEMFRREIIGGTEEEPSIEFRQDADKLDVDAIFEGEVTDDLHGLIYYRRDADEPDVDELFENDIEEIQFASKDDIDNLFKEGDENNK